MAMYTNPSGEYTNEETQYMKYIKDHISRVKKSFDERGPMLQRVMNLTHEEMSDLAARVAKHDDSKFSNEEFPQYRNWFYPAENEMKNDSDFAKAWEHHYKTNDHHPEYWVVNGVANEMSRVAVAEMILDWEAMSRTFGGNPRSWYATSKSKFVFNPKTEFLVDRALNILYREDDNLKEYRNPIIG